MQVTQQAEWDQILAGEFQKPYWFELQKFLESERQTKTILPPPRGSLYGLSTDPLFSGACSIVRARPVPDFWACAWPLFFRQTRGESSGVFEKHLQRITQRFRNSPCENGLPDSLGPTGGLNAQHGFDCAGRAT